MVDKVTLILILHNRHKNLDRLLEYYKGYNFPILIADSSATEHQFGAMQQNWIYSYTPGLSFTKKLEVVLDKVITPYTVMCADDDFIIPDSILQCVAFLENNSNYAIAQGLTIRYEKESVTSASIQYGALYYNYKSIEENEALERLAAMFKNYHSVFYGVFRTAVLKNSFEGAGIFIKKLYLNEYITAFLPILYGKYKELPILYHVREYAQDSDDKTAADLDTLLSDKQYESEMQDFKNFISFKIASFLSVNAETVSKSVNNIINEFAIKIQEDRNRIQLKKRIGNLIVYLPFIGAWMIKKNRAIENKNRLNAYIDVGNIKKDLETISKILIKYGKQ